MQSQTPGWGPLKLDNADPRLSTDSWLCQLTNSSLRTEERDQITRTSSRPSVHRHQSTRIPSFRLLYTSLELAVMHHSWLQHLGLVKGSPLQITQRGTHSIGGISQLGSFPIIYPDLDPEPTMLNEAPNINRRERHCWNFKLYNTSSWC